MSLQPVAEYRVPDDTARVANAIFPKGNIYIILASELKTFLKDEDFAELFPNKGQPAESPLRLALATILQYIEGLTDRQTADAVRTRIDWKYLLCLELTDSGFHHTVATRIPHSFNSRGSRSSNFGTTTPVMPRKRLVEISNVHQDRFNSCFRCDSCRN